MRVRLASDSLLIASVIGAGGVRDIIQLLDPPKLPSGARWVWQDAWQCFTNEADERVIRLRRLAFFVYEPILLRDLDQLRAYVNGTSEERLAIETEVRPLYETAFASGK